MGVRRASGLVGSPDNFTRPSAAPLLMLVHAEPSAWESKH